MSDLEFDIQICKADLSRLFTLYVQQQTREELLGEDQIMIHQDEDENDFVGALVKKLSQSRKDGQLRMRGLMGVDNLEIE